jgi:hypothetical protein
MFIVTEMDEYTSATVTTNRTRKLDLIHLQGENYIYKTQSKQYTVLMLT